MTRTVAVLGGGIAGLSACYHLSKSSQVSKVVLLERDVRCGGWLRSTVREDGAVFEHGPRGVRPAGAVGMKTLNMVCDLGLERQVLPVTREHVASKNRFLYVCGRLHRMPSGVRSVIRTVPPFSRPLILSLVRECFIHRGTDEDETIHSFMERRVGTELTDLLIDSLCRGVFAGDCRMLSMRSCFPPLFNAERKHGSFLLGLLVGRGDPSGAPPPSSLALRAVGESWTQWSLAGGMQVLPEALQESVRQDGRVAVHTSAAVTGLQRTPAGWEIKLQDGRIKADHIISALPAKALASLLPPSAKALSEELRNIAMVTVVVVNLEYDGDILPVTGFGHLVPSTEDCGVLGIVYDSVTFPQHNRPGAASTRLTVMLGGAWFQQEFGGVERVTEQALLRRATRAVRDQLGVTVTPCWSHVCVLKDCIPQYYVGHWKRLENISRCISQQALPLSLAGASYGGVSVNDVIDNARRAAESLLGTL